MLEDALIGYEGAALIVSHDRYFISRVANRIVEIRDGELVLYRGNFDYYLEKKREEEDAKVAQIELAKREELDLIEISPNANPPVCKIMDMGKYKYDLQKKANQAKKKQKIVSLKEIKLRPGTETHDYNFKIKNAKKFLQKGDKVKFTVRFKGREMQHIELGKNLMNRIIEDTKEIGKVEVNPKFEGRQMIMIIHPN